MPASNIADRHAWLHRLGDDRQLLLCRKTASARDPADHLDLRKRVGHRHMPRTIPRPSGYRRCPVETGCSSERQSRIPNRLGIPEPLVRVSKLAFWADSLPETAGYLCVGADLSSQK